MNFSLRRRLTIVGIVMGLIVAQLLYRLTILYLGHLGTDAGYFAETALTQYRYQVTVRPPRGEIYDRNGVLLATNAVDYEISMSPSIIYDREQVAREVSEVTGIPYDELIADMAPDAQGNAPVYVPVMRPASAAIGEELIERDLGAGVVIEPLPRRYYPHGSLAAHVLGFANLDSEGSYGVEGYYDSLLKGRATVDDQSRIPFDASSSEIWQTGSTLQLTLDSEIQHLAEQTLASALEKYEAESGTIIVMDPGTGEIIAMANAPTYDPNRYYSSDYQLFVNPAVSYQYEPGSTFKALTMALALEQGVVTPESTYEDRGVLEVAGVDIYNWDRAVHGTTTMTELLAQSLNIGAATLSLRMGPTAFYDGLEQFRIGLPTEVDLEGEATGTLRRPGDANWFESDLAINAFGQALNSTPLQMITAFSAIANDGLLLQPHIVRQRVDPDGTTVTFDTVVLDRPISQQTANTLSEMLASALERESSAALVEGYRIAGKTGTAQIPVPGGYDEEETIHSFIGYGPIDDPQFLVLVKLDRPDPDIAEFGSQSAGPVFGEFVSRLVVLMEIPPDDIRLNMPPQAAAGG